MTKTIDFTISGGGDFGVVPVDTVSDPKVATARNGGRYRIEGYSARLTAGFKARIQGAGEYVSDLGTFALAKYFAPLTDFWMKSSGGELTTDPFETGTLVGSSNSDGSLSVNRVDYLITDDDFITDDDDNAIEADR